MTLSTIQVLYRNSTGPYILGVVGSLLSFLLGASVLIGWFTQNSFLIQVAPSFVPMQFNTALCFLLSGAGLLLLNIHRTLAFSMGISVLLVSLLTLGEYIFAVNFGIDQLLMDHYITVQTSHPGRMAPNTALCFSLVGVALFIYSYPFKQAVKTELALGLLASLVFGLAVVALSGYLVSFESAYGWGRFTRMAVHTSIGFTFLGTAIFALSCHRDKDELSSLPPSFPFIITIGALTIVVSLWQALTVNEAILIASVGTAGKLDFINRIWLFSGITFSAVLGYTAYISQTARRRQLTIEETNKRLSIEIDVRKRQQEQLSLMAHYDLLTGLPNRSLFIDRFTQAIAHSKRTENQLAICFLDLDNFKPVNDNHGHQVGDQLLIEVAKRITDNMRDEDTVSRQGGDEFTLLLNDIEDAAQIKQTLQRIHHALTLPYVIDNHTHNITASTGVTLYPSDEGDIDTLIRHADQAMYQAKLAGKNRYHLFNAEHDQRTIKKHLQLDEVEHALTNNELQLYYQPKVNMATGEVFGLEALIRWIHPDKGLIPPLDFLPSIEGTDLEIKIGDWVVNEALVQLERWQQQGIRLEVSVNISSHHMLSKFFFDQLKAVLAKHPSVHSRCLQLEILESSALGDINAISTIVESCQGALGVKVALDDFGTGYSSLTHLRNLSADTVKIDRSFVRDILDDPNDYSIIKGIIGLAGSFSREIIAEGVETTNQGLMLLMMGCEEAQGYGIAKPMPADDFPLWLEDYIPNPVWQKCGHKYHSLKEGKVKLFRLVTEHWKGIFINNIESSHDEVEHWPIMNSKQCHCGSWIKRARQERLFTEGGLTQLDEAHEALHLVTQALRTQYLGGHADAARAGLAEYQLAFGNMSHALRLCE